MKAKSFASWSQELKAGEKRGTWHQSRGERLLTGSAKVAAALSFGGGSGICGMYIHISISISIHIYLCLLSHSTKHSQTLVSHFTIARNRKEKKLHLAQLVVELLLLLQLQLQLLLQLHVLFANR